MSGFLRDALRSPFLVLILYGLVLGGCSGADEYGFVEVTVLPGLSVDSLLELGTDRFKVREDAPTVLRESVGKQTLKVKQGDRTTPFCSFTVRRDKVVTITVLTIGGDLKCRVADPGSDARYIMPEGHAIASATLSQFP